MPEDGRPAHLRRVGIELLAASFVVLFQELALIRWLPVEVRVVAYFPNLILIGAFLGLGVGALRAAARPRMWVWPVTLLAVVGAAWALRGVAFTANEASEHLWLLYADLPKDAPVVEGIRLPIVLFFVLSSLSFVPLGQFVGTRLEMFRARSSALWGYALDLGGSLLGVIGFAAVSWSGLRPAFWFLPPLLVGIVFFGTSLRTRLITAAVCAVILAAVTVNTGSLRFSPYYALETLASPASVMVRTNGSLHQIAFNVEAPTPGGMTSTAKGYRYPYERLGRPIRKALVLGAGTGNDVATLLLMGAQEVHAVEIDPVILQLGRELHPNHPYDDPRVTVHNTDARSFLNETDERYDVIAFGTLDSMTRLSALSNVRLDNFVYTREALVAARDHLTDDGGLVLYFMVGQPFISGHLTALLANTFGRLPDTHLGDYSLFNTVFMAGPAFTTAGQAPAEADAWFLQDDLVQKLSPSDDWPYLYLPTRGVNSFYLSMMVILALLAIAAILAVSPEMRGALRRGKGVDVEMFLYGFAFLLMETKFVTAMNLLWGATWLTSAVVFGSILAVILAGTLFTELRPIPWPVAGAGLVLGLLAVYALPLQALLSTSPAVRLALSVLYVGAPVLFASLCFASRFKVRPMANLAFGWNLLGAVLGGLTEFFSMAVGLRALMLVAVAAYLAAFLLARRDGPRVGLAPTARSP
ncbi:MAG TPA: hypothetical protein VJ997_02865 [Longimicrobiales bacterium]|nr:hypothetical protein [Longimicrobiales bacterium]